MARRGAPDKNERQVPGGRRDGVPVLRLGAAARGGVARGRDRSALRPLRDGDSARAAAKKASTRLGLRAGRFAVQRTREGAVLAASSCECPSALVGPDVDPALRHVHEGVKAGQQRETEPSVVAPVGIEAARSRSRRAARAAGSAPHARPDADGLGQAHSRGALGGEQQRGLARVARPASAAGRSFPGGGSRPASRRRRRWRSGSSRRAERRLPDSWRREARGRGRRDRRWPRERDSRPRRRRRREGRPRRAGSRSRATSRPRPTARRRTRWRRPKTSGRERDAEARREGGGDRDRAVFGAVDRRAGSAGPKGSPERGAARRGARRDSPSRFSKRARPPPTKASGTAPVGSPTQARSRPRTMAAGSETSRQRVGDVELEDKPRRAGGEEPPVGAREGEAQRGCRPPESGRGSRSPRRRVRARAARASWSAKSQARRQKYDRVRSSRRTGSETTRVTPSWSMK